VYNDEYYKFRFEDMLTKNYPNLNFKFYHLVKNTDGAAETINIALKNLNLDYDLPVLCLDSDNFYTEDVITKWNKSNSIFYFEDYNSNPIYSYIVCDKNFKIIDIKEKEKISNMACCGAYGFESYYTLLQYTNIIIQENLRFKNEFYTSSCIKRMLNDELKFIPILVDKKHFHCLGTPLQLKQFYNNVPNISCISNLNKNKALRICFDLDNTLVTYPKVKDDYTTVEPITKNINFVKYLKKFGNTIIIYTARRMKSYLGNEGKVMANIGKITFDTLERFEIPYDELYFGKPYADFYIDDNSISAFSDLEKEIGFYQDTIKPRDFNNIEMNTIEIYTKISKNLSGEIYYYKNIPIEIKDMFPIFIDNDINNTWYSIEKIHGLTLSNLYLSQLLTFETLEHVMKSIKRIHSVIVRHKLENRYTTYDYSKFKNSEKVFHILYNQLLEYENKNKGKISCIHGDTVFTNILVNNYEKIKFIDMRGIQGDKLTIYGDWLYDWAKFYQSLIGYDEILLDKEISKEYKKYMINKFEEIYLSWYSNEDLNNMKMITNSLLFTLIPLHDNEKCIKYYELISLLNN